MKKISSLVLLVLVFFTACSRSLHHTENAYNKPSEMKSIHTLSPNAKVFYKTSKKDVCGDKLHFCQD